MVLQNYINIETAVSEIIPCYAKQQDK